MKPIDAAQQLSANLQQPVVAVDVGELMTPALIRGHFLASLGCSGRKNDARPQNSHH